MSTSSKIKAIFCLLLFYCLSFSQTGWFQQTSGSSAILNSIFFVDVNIGYAVGSGGTILKTTNSGINWLNISFNNTDFFYSVYFIQNTGYVVGINGVIYKTINAGLSWVTQISGTPYNLYSVYFIDANTGYIAGHYPDPPNSIIRKTTNGGTSWQSVIFPPNAYGLNSIYFISSNTGFAVGRFGVIIQTTNAGSSWNMQSIGPNQAIFISICFSNISTGYVVGGEPFASLGLIYKTINGGVNWTAQSSGVNNYLYSVTIPPQLGSDTVFCAGTNGKILKTINGGLLWSDQNSGTNINLTDINFTTFNTGYAVGHNGIILKTTTGGLTLIQPISNEIPSEFKLYQNYPNPFNPKSRIKFSIGIPSGQIAKLSETKLALYNILGKEIEILVNEQLSPGTFEVELNAANYPSGVYYYQLTAGGFTETKKLVIIK